MVGVAAVGRNKMPNIRARSKKYGKTFVRLKEKRYLCTAFGIT
jgi:hypothetical protein